MIPNVISDYSLGKTEWENTSLSDGESLFLTQSKFRYPEEVCKYGWHFEWHFRHGRKQQTTGTVCFKTGFVLRCIEE